LNGGCHSFQYGRNKKKKVEAMASANMKGWELLRGKDKKRSKKKDKKRSRKKIHGYSGTQA